MNIRQNIAMITKFLTKNNVNPEIFLLIIKEIEILNENYNYNTFYCNEYKLILMLQLDDGVNKCPVLEKLIFYSHKTKKHYETIRT
jgi:hypothetical protein